MRIRKLRRGATAAVLVAAAFTLSACLPVPEIAEDPIQATTEAPEAPAPEPEEETPEPEPEVVPEKGDVDAKLTTLSKECFGSAGCHVEVVVDLSLSVSPTAPFDVTLSIIGGEQEQIQTISVDADGMYDQETYFVTTVAEGDKLTAKVTSVRGR